MVRGLCVTLVLIVSVLIIQDRLQRFALAMVAAGDRLSDGSVHIGEEAIDAGLAKVCPAYPLCSK